jgi:hypothetical protein
MPIDIPLVDLVRQLHRVGVRPPTRLVERILEHPAAARGPLLALATERDLLTGDAPGCWGPIHGLRLLGELRDVTTLEPILECYPLPLAFEGQKPPMLWATDATQLLGHIGAAAVEPLWAIFDDEQRPFPMRGAASEALPYVTAADPATRDGIVDGFRARLLEAAQPDLLALIINGLCRLGVAAAYSEVLAAFRAGRVDTDMITAAAARKLLLGGGSTNLTCANHALWDRYDEHGPRE